MKIIDRPKYLSTLINVMDTPDIKVITGIRRCGKSQLLLALIDYIKKKNSSANIIYINLQQLEFESLLEYHQLHEYVLSHYDRSVNNYLFVDEVQLCDGFEKAINSLHSQNILDIYITGSNAFLLSSDLATLFTGRTYTVEVFPFSFMEFLDYFDYKGIDEDFEEYVMTGGFAGSYLYKTVEEKYDYIKKDVYETIVTRDLVQKYKIRNKEVLNGLVAYMIDNISNLMSSNNVTHYLRENNYSITHKTIGNYINYLCNAFVFYRAKRYDLRGKKYLATENKFYLCDHSIKYAVLGTRNIDYGRMYENIVYIELLRRGYDVYIGKLYKKEI
ncbi:ATP-binding protein, partial [Candidatus Micrarchaeota archaeon]|nr:ATP-binding protein [Candidatus Micrarchaeota archaeon]